MAKKLSKRKEEERRVKLALAKKQRLALIFSAIPAFILTVTMIVLYAGFDISRHWLTATTAALWYALGALFIYATVKKWGYVTNKGDEAKKNFSAITIYNIVLVFALAAFFTFLFFRDLF